MDTAPEYVSLGVAVSVRDAAVVRETEELAVGLREPFPVRVALAELVVVRVMRDDRVGIDDTELVLDEALVLEVVPVALLDLEGGWLAVCVALLLELRLASAVPVPLREPVIVRELDALPVLVLVGRPVFVGPGELVPVLDAVSDLVLVRDIAAERDASALAVGNDVAKELLDAVAVRVEVREEVAVRVGRMGSAIRPRAPIACSWQ